MRRLVARGLAVIFITHKLNEAFAYGDRITILRLGRKVGEIGPERLKAMDEGAVTAEIVRLMFGAAAARSGGGASAGADALRAPRGRGATPVLEVARPRRARSRARSLARRSTSPWRPAKSSASPASTATARSSSPRRWPASGPLPRRRDPARRPPIERLDVGARRRLGLRYVTDDRLAEGTVASFPVSTNFLLKQIGEPPFWQRGIDRPAAIAAHARRLVRDFDVRTPGIGDADRPAFRRQHPEGAAGARAVRRRQGRDLRQADRRPRRAEHPSRRAGASARPPTPASRPS